MCTEATSFNSRGLLLWAVAAVLVLSARVQAQPTFSIDFQGPTMAMGVDFFNLDPAHPIFEGDILSAPFPGGPLGVPTPGPFAVSPGVVINGGPVLIPGDPPGLGIGPFFMELDALSYGTDPPISGPLEVSTIFFSVDEFAEGEPAVLDLPSVSSEGRTGAGEASADIFANTALVPMFPGAAPVGAVGNVRILDGDGLDSGAPVLGLALIEPNPATLFAIPDPGDNLDALDMDWSGGPTGFDVYFSLDAAFPDPLESVVMGVVPNTGTAAGMGFAPGDVLVVVPHTFPIVPIAVAIFAPAVALGLDLVPGAGAGSDDLDALVLAENGTGMFEPSMTPYDWLGVGGPDMLLFSVRRGSAVIGEADSLYGAPIAEGDILTTPIPMAAGGLSLYPAIFVPAEWLGLATARARPLPTVPKIPLPAKLTPAGPIGTHGLMSPVTAMIPRGDDLDALDIVP